MLLKSFISTNRIRILRKKNWATSFQKSLGICIILGSLICLTVAPSAALSSPKWGIYVGSSKDLLTSTKILEDSLGNKFENVLYYNAITDDFNINLANQVKDNNKHLQIILEFFDPNLDTDQPKYRLSTITNGDHDADITRWANQVKNFNDIVYLTPLSEMNGYWQTWSGVSNGNTPSDFIPAWRHIRDIFTATGTTNVKWVWAVNAVSVPNIPSNSPNVYYPGDNYVDYIGIDGYNFGPPDEPWLSFRNIFMPMYQKISQTISSTKPMMIMETACSEAGGDKAKWINDMFYDLSYSFPQVVQVNWFNRNKERDWRIESSNASLEAFRSNFAVKNNDISPTTNSTHSPSPTHIIKNNINSTHDKQQLDIKETIDSTINTDSASSENNSYSKSEKYLSQNNSINETTMIKLIGALIIFAQIAAFILFRNLKEYDNNRKHQKHLKKT